MLELKITHWKSETQQYLSSFDKFPWGQEACTYKLCCPNNSKSIYIVKLGAEDRFIAETSLSKNSSTGMSATEMSTVDLSTTEIFSFEMSAAECPPLNVRLWNIHHWNIRRWMSTSKESAPATSEMSTTEWLLLGPIPKSLLLKTLPWFVSNISTNRQKFLVLKYLQLKCPPLKCPPLNCYYLVIVIIY